MIRFERVTFTYPGANHPTLRDLTLEITAGELCLVIGETGAGKSTLLRAIDGLVPHFTGGRLEGDVVVAGRSIRTHRPRALADIVGFVGQDPAAGFVSDTVEDELAYSMENLGLEPGVMRRRVEDTLDLLALTSLRARSLTTLSGGEQQRVAIGAALTAHPQVLVLDEPTSALDPLAAEEVLAALTRLVHDLGITVVLAEHRLERVVQYADRVVYLPGDGFRVVSGPPAGVLEGSPVAPPVVRLARVAGWSPPPLSVRDARRAAGVLRSLLPEAPVEAPVVAPDASVSEPLVRVRGLAARYGAVRALRRADLEVRGGEVVAVMGRNGAGKSTLLAHLAGLIAPQRGEVRVGGERPHSLAARRLVRSVGLVPQDPAVLLYADRVDTECASVDHDAGLIPGTTLSLAEEIVVGLDPAAHPRDLSEGQRLGLALAVVLAPAPPVVLLDEPTRGLDYLAKDRLVVLLRRLAESGHAVVLATHDVELVADVADRVVVLADGEVVADGPTRSVVCHSPVFSPQVAKILHPSEWLTAAEVEAALAGVAGG